MVRLLDVAFCVVCLAASRVTFHVQGPSLTTYKCSVMAFQDTQRHAMVVPAGLADVWTFNWCGSAVVGGYLLDWYGFRVSFALTALFQLIGWALLLLLLPVVPRHEGSEATAAVAPPEHTSAAAAEAVVAATEPELAQPLLAAQN